MDEFVFTHSTGCSCFSKTDIRLVKTNAGHNHTKFTENFTMTSFNQLCCGKRRKIA